MVLYNRYSRMTFNFVYRYRIVVIEGYIRVSTYLSKLISTNTYIVTFRGLLQTIGELFKTELIYIENKSRKVIRINCKVI
jgi:hypothetical protein